MADLPADPTLAELVTADHGTARILESFGLDYCCGGGRRLAEACAGEGIDPADVLDAIADLAPSPPDDWARMGPAELVDHLVATHHAYLHRELARLEALADKVVEVHGRRHPELDGVAATYRVLRVDLEPHLATEEEVLFPTIRRLVAGGGSGVSPPVGRPADAIATPITLLTAEHDHVGAVLTSLRRLTTDYTAPAEACGSYRAFYDGLAELEADTHLHVHKENNLLFPAVLELERLQAPPR